MTSGPFPGIKPRAPCEAHDLAQLLVEGRKATPTTAAPLVRIAPKNHSLIHHTAALNDMLPGWIASGRGSSVSPQRTPSCRDRPRSSSGPRAQPPAHGPELDARAP